MSNFCNKCGIPIRDGILCDFHHNELIEKNHKGSQPYKDLKVHADKLETALINVCDECAPKCEDDKVKIKIILEALKHYGDFTEKT